MQLKGQDKSWKEIGEHFTSLGRTINITSYRARYGRIKIALEAGKCLSDEDVSLNSLQTHQID
jgi:hypothetical protein